MEKVFTGNTSGYTIHRNKLNIFVQHKGRMYFITNLLPVLREYVTIKHENDLKLYNFDSFVFVPLYLEKKRLHAYSVQKVLRNLEIPKEIKDRAVSPSTYDELYNVLYDSIRSMQYNESSVLDYTIALSALFNKHVPIKDITYHLTPNKWSVNQ